MKEAVCNDSDKSKDDQKIDNSCILPAAWRSSSKNTNEDMVMFFPPEPEVDWLVRNFAPYLNPSSEDARRNCCSRLMASIFVAPLCNFTNFSIYYQLYLNEIFHRELATKLSHYIFMPLVNLFLMLWLLHFVMVPSYPLIFNGGSFYAFCIGWWWFLWMSHAGYMTIGLISACFAAFLYCTALVLEHSKLIPVHPLWLILFSACCVCFGHSFEPWIPPRINGTEHWILLHDIFKTRGTRAGVYTVIYAATCGIMDEFIACPRLLPVLALRLAFRLGYRPERWQELQKITRLALANNNPAIDYIGDGGTKFSVVNATKLTLDHIRKHQGRLLNGPPVISPAALSIQQGHKGFDFKIE